MPTVKETSIMPIIVSSQEIVETSIRPTLRLSISKDSRRKWGSAPWERVVTMLSFSTSLLSWDWPLFIVVFLKDQFLGTPSTSLRSSLVDF